MGSGGWWKTATLFFVNFKGRRGDMKGPSTTEVYTVYIYPGSPVDQTKIGNGLWDDPWSKDS